MEEDWRPLLGGHRGLGCTDHPFYGERRQIASLPVENTRQSVELALARGADFVEIDVVQSSDGELFCLHNVRPADHFFIEPPRKALNALKWHEFKDARTGQTGAGRICTLSEMLDTVRRGDRNAGPFVINIEIKGNQGTPQPVEPLAFFDRIAAVVAGSGINPRRVLFSSFCLQSVIEMAHRMSAARFAMLFQEGAATRSIYSANEGDLRFMYLPFERNYVDYATYTFTAAVGNKAVLGYVHPEVSTLATDDLVYLTEMALGVNCWALFEELTEERIEVYRQLTKVARQRRARLGIITDYLVELREALLALPS
jgi:glycerophosphoryl diester phosphodiesterase